MQRTEFFLGSEGYKEKGDKICFVMHLCACKANFFLTPHFFHFAINIGFVIPKEEFRKDNLYRGIKVIFQM